MRRICAGALYVLAISMALAGFASTSIDGLFALLGLGLFTAFIAKVVDPDFKIDN